MAVSHYLAPAGPPVLSQTDAVRLFQRIISRPPQTETLVLALDDSFVCSVALTVAGTGGDDELIGIVQWLGGIAQHRPIATVALGAVRPDGCIRPDDGPLWFDLYETAEHNDIELLDLLVLGRYGNVSVGATLGLGTGWVL